MQTPGKNSSLWEAFEAELPRHNGHPKAIHHAVIDMNAAYIKGMIDNFENSRVAYAKFQVIHNVA